MKEPPQLPIYQDGLAIFLGELRDRVFTSQADAADYFGLNRSRITRYESHANSDKPQVGYLAELARLVAENFPPPADRAEVRHKLLHAVNQALRSDYHRRPFKSWPDLVEVAEAYMTRQREKSLQKALAPSLPPSRGNWQTGLNSRFDLPPIADLVGVEPQLDRLLNQLKAEQIPWLIAIEGIGGLGKTALANALLRHASLADRFHQAAWVSAKKRDFMPGLPLPMDDEGPGLSPGELVGSLLNQLALDLPLAQPFEHKLTALTNRLKQVPHLIIIDNLETVQDYEVLLPLLPKLANPSKILLTSRHSLSHVAEIFSHTISDLTSEHALRLLRQEAEQRGVSSLTEADDHQLEPIYRVVGGNPLALKLVVGQAAVLSLPEVLSRLQHAPNQSIEALYTFLYWQAWQTLNEASRRVLLVMPLAQEGQLEQLAVLTQLDPDSLERAIQQLVRLSLLQVGGTLETRRYSIHRLTETFILNEAVGWRQ